MFKNVHNITAGAGAGKTTRLVNIIKELVDNNADPQKMILTTYTVAAATEFREKTKERLICEGKVREAILMDAAVIGTVHSIASSYISRYWYLLGVSPSIKPMDDTASKILMDRSLNEILSGKDEDLFREYAKIFSISGSEGYDFDFWKKTMNALFSKMRGYGFNTEKLKDFRKGTLDLLKSTFTMAGNAAVFNNQRQILEEYLGFGEVVSRSATDAGKAQYQKNCESVRKILAINPATYSVKDSKEIDALKWGREISLAAGADKDNFQETIKESKNKVIEAQKNILSFLVPAESSLILKVAEKIFDLMDEWIKSYDIVKKENAVIDYSDMEDMFLTLLGMEEVQEDIRNSVDYLFVDEFQDSTPIQAEIFKILSGLVKQTWFVGDRKQAIYGFAGSDSGLIKDLTENFPKPVKKPLSLAEYKKDENGNSSEILSVSYRSVPTLVTLANKVFSESFAEVVSGYDKDKIDIDEVTLSPKEGKTDPPYDVLYHLDVSGSNESTRCQNLASVICHIANSAEFKEHYSPSDIAVLTRKNQNAGNIAAAIAATGLNVSFVDENYLSTPEVSFLICLLKLSAGISMKRTRAELRKLILDEDLKELICKVKDGRNDLSELSGLEEFATSLRHKSVIDRIKESIMRFNLSDYCGVWGNPSSRRGHISTLINAAEAYSSQSELFCSSADVRGFISFLSTFCPDTKFDNTSSGIKVLTCHKAKGLEWKIVFLYGLDEYKEDKSISGIIRPLSTPDSLLAIPSLPGKDWVYTCIDSSPEAKTLLEEVSARQNGEEKRLLYVALTRARDVIVTVGKGGPLETIIKCCPTARNIQETDTADGYVDIWGAGVKSKIIEYSLDEEIRYNNAESINMYSDAGFLRKELQEEKAERKFHSPSKFRDSEIENAAEVTIKKDFGYRTDIDHGGLSDDVFGDCIHHIFACCRPGEKESNLGVASRTFTSFGITDPQAAQKAVHCIDNLFGWLEETFGPATGIEHEVPFRYTDSKGRVFSGSMDMIWKTEKGDVLIDYKTYSGTKAELLDKERKHWAGHYASQLHIYTTALKSAERKVLSALLYYPVNGLVVSVKP